jgi:hypothetical protein
MRLLGGSFSREELALMTRALKAAVEKLPRERRTPDDEVFLAAQILICAAGGERDPRGFWPQKSPRLRRLRVRT